MGWWIRLWVTVVLLLETLLVRYFFYTMGGTGRRTFLIKSVDGTVQQVKNMLLHVRKAQESPSVALTEVVADRPH